MAKTTTPGGLAGHFVLSLIWGLAIAVSVQLNLFWLLPLVSALRLFIGVLLGFVVWTLAVVYGLSVSRTRQLLFKLSVPLAASLALNAIVRFL